MNKTILSLIIGIIILAALFYSIGIEKIMLALINIDLLLFTYAAIAFLAMELVLSMKLKVIAPEAKIKEIFLSHEGGMFFSNLTPGRFGYFYAAYSLAKKTQTSISERIGLLTLIQGLTMVTKILILVVAFIYLSWIINIPSVLLLAFAAPVAVVVLTILILYTRLSNHIISRIPLVGRIVRYLELMQNAARNVRRKDIIKLLSIDPLCWVLGTIQLALLAGALGMQMDILMVLFVSQIVSVLMFIPISPAGLGVTEGGGVILLLLLGFTAPQSVSLILLWRINSIVV
ncbi:MAG: lysylphosphatidylglycerol synthase transmembrane domain-containing protein, partial [Candidatus Aenigmatarchaeota archaeon]